MLTFRRLSCGLGLAVATAIAAGGAHAQTFDDAGRPGSFGGMPSFGGFYETFGPNGGVNGYAGYRRPFETGTPHGATILSTPVAGPTDANPGCDWLKRRLRQTGARARRARYAACLRGE